MFILLFYITTISDRIQIKTEIHARFMLLDGARQAGISCNYTIPALQLLLSKFLKADKHKRILLDKKKMIICKYD